MHGLSILVSFESFETACFFAYPAYWNGLGITHNQRLDGNLPVSWSRLITEPIAISPL